IARGRGAVSSWDIDPGTRRLEPVRGAVDERPGRAPGVRSAVQPVASPGPVIKFRFAIDVARPVHDVFEYVTDPAKLREWQGTDNVEQVTEGPVDLGTRLREVRVVLGRRLESVTEVVAYEPDRRFEIRILSG